MERRIDGLRYRWSLSGLVLLGILAGCATGPSKKVQQANIHRRVGERHLAQMRIAQALAEFQKALQLNPRDAQLQHDMGLAFLLRQEFDKAETYLLRALQLDGALSEARNHLAVVYLEQNRPYEALGQLERALKDPDFTSTAKAYLNKAKAHLQLGDEEAAIEAFEGSIERNPSDVRPYLELAKIHLNRQDYPSAVLAARRAVEFYPEDYRGWYLLGKAFLGSNDRRRAVEAFRKTREKAPEGSEEFTSAGYLLEELGGV